MKLAEPGRRRFIRPLRFNRRVASSEIRKILGPNLEYKIDDQGLYLTNKHSEDIVTVYVTEKGGKYHTDGCRYLKKSKLPMVLKEAKKQYRPCTQCKPPK